ncbi:hypothetical protein, partial [Geomesophilobacter sediminis]|uniref:hypothetical protein n=1 Tax=Geomesophilobacter sediminis TaxID=2798584 RepID=UPI001C06CFFC
APISTTQKYAKSTAGATLESMGQQWGQAEFYNQPTRKESSLPPFLSLGGGFDSGLSPPSDWSIAHGYKI